MDITAHHVRESTPLAAGDGRLPPVLRRRWLPPAAVALLAAATGAASGVVWPLGPVSTVAALATMALGGLLGLLGGYVLRSAWSVVPVALVYLAATEIARSSITLPTVHDVRFDSVYGVLALVLGRGIPAVLLVLPMILGARVGSAFARRDGVAPRHPRAATLTTAALGLVTGALAVVIALPATTPPVLDADGEVLPGSIAVLETVRLGGDDHALMIRAADPDNPVMLYLSGGPGQSDLAFARALSEPWVDDVVFATFDQRGNGKSYSALLPTDEATLERAVADVIELTEHLRARFDQDKVILMGESWGTILGVLAVEQRPDLFSAWIGSGQMVDIAETDGRIYRDLQAYAERTGDEQTAALTQRIGAPPYADIPWANSSVMAAYDYLYDPYTPSEGYLARGSAAGLGPWGILGVEYTAMDKISVLRGLVDTFTVMYPQLQSLDLRRDAPRLEVPVLILDGAAELDGRRDLALEWYAELEAPAKQLATFAGAAHSVAFEQADAVDRLLAEDVLPVVAGP